MNQPKFIDIANAPERSDEELFVEFSQGVDHDILATIFRKHMTLIFGVCLKHLGEKHAAQQAVLEVFEWLINHPVKTKVNNFRAYLFVVTRNHCLMKKRGEKVTFTEISERDIELAMEVHPMDAGSAESEKALKKCVGQLKELQKLCVQQFYFGKKSYLELSTELKITLTAVKSHIQNGKRNLKSCIEADL